MTASVLVVDELVERVGAQHREPDRKLAEQESADRLGAPIGF